MPKSKPSPATRGTKRKGEHQDRQKRPSQPKFSSNETNVHNFNLTNVTLPGTSNPSDITITSDKITSIKPHNNNLTSTQQPGHIHSKSAALLAPSLCHPHIHLDKAYLISHPRYRDSQTLKDGTFAEAMSLTSKAKANFGPEDLVERGLRVLEESIEAGVTHMRAFVEVDAIAKLQCLTVALELKKVVERKCMVQICIFAQVPIFSDSGPVSDGEGGDDGEMGGGESDWESVVSDESGSGAALGTVLKMLKGDDADLEDASDGGSGVDEGGELVRTLLTWESVNVGVDVIGSTPYVEADRERMQKNVEWMVDLAIRSHVHLDFHLDYNLDPNEEPMVWFVLKTLKEKCWNEKNPGKTVVLGHCTRLSLFPDQEWKKLAEEIGDLPVSFVGLPTSDLFMMRTPERTRGTLPIPSMIKDYGLNACIGVNNIGNAFTPQGSCDPLSLACSCVGVYSAGTKEDAEILYECVSTRAREAIGLGRGDKRVDTEIREGDSADLLLFGSEKRAWRTRTEVSEAVYLYDSCKGRSAISGGRYVD
jgi:cytosine/adenosine deaminase-related metal-dependent hydrolase